MHWVQISIWVNCCLISRSKKVKRKHQNRHKTTCVFDCTLKLGVEKREDWPSSVHKLHSALKQNILSFDTYVALLRKPIIYQPFSLSKQETYINEHNLGETLTWKGQKVETTHSKLTAVFSARTQQNEFHPLDEQRPRKGM